MREILHIYDARRSEIAQEFEKALDERLVTPGVSPVHVDGGDLSYTVGDIQRVRHLSLSEFMVDARFGSAVDEIHFHCGTSRYEFLEAVSLLGRGGGEHKRLYVEGKVMWPEGAVEAGDMARHHGLVSGRKAYSARAFA